MWSIMRKMAFSLPGMMRALSTTVSPFSTETCLWLSTATRGQRRHGLALRAGNQERPLCRGGRSMASCGRSRMPSGMSSRPRECAISVTDTMLRPITATRRPILLRQVEHQLDAVNRRAETGDHHAALGAVEDLFHARADGALRFGIAGTVGVGGIREQQQHAALAVIGQGVQVEQLVIGGGRIDLEIAGVDDDAEGRGDGQRHGADDRVGDVDELDFERSDLHDLLGLHLDEARLFLEFVFLQAPVHQRERESGAVYRDIDFREEIGDRADVVFVAVRQDDGPDLRTGALSGTSGRASPGRRPAARLRGTSSRNRPR